MVFQLVAGLVLMAALAGAFLSWKADIRAEGEARAVAEYQEQQKARDIENLRLAQEGELEAKRLLAEQQKRNRLQAAQMAQAEAKRRSDSEQRAQNDRTFADWRSQRLPDYVVDQLRIDTEPAARSTPSSDLPAGTRAHALAKLSADAINEQFECRYVRVCAGADRPDESRMASNGRRNEELQRLVAQSTAR